MYAACMATKTISIDLEAYEKLVKARIDPKESFSKVIHRAEWPEPARTCGAMVELLFKLDPLDLDTLEMLDVAQAEDLPPDSKWQNG